LKCDQCKVSFDSYDQPKFLPCHETICSPCVVKIEKEAVNKMFKCSICLEEHFVPKNGFPIDKTKYALITAEPIEVSRGENYERLQDNLDQVKSKAKLLWSECENGVEIIKEHYNEQIRLIQLSTESKIEQMNKLSDELIAFIREYEKEYLNKHESTKVDINKILRLTVSLKRKV
jgi:hypothetical protein